LTAIRNPESYLFTIAINLAHEYAERKRRAQSTLDVNDPTVEAELAELPSFGGQLDAAERTRRLREVIVRAAGEMSVGGGAVLPGGTEVRGDRATGRDLHPHGQEIPESGARPLPASHGAMEVNAWTSAKKQMNSRKERKRALVAEEAADWFVAHREDLDDVQRDTFNRVAEGIKRARGGISRGHAAQRRPAQGGSRLGAVDRCAFRACTRRGGPDGTADTSASAVRAGRRLTAGLVIHRSCGPRSPSSASPSFG